MAAEKNPPACLRQVTRARPGSSTIGLKRRHDQLETASTISLKCRLRSAEITVRDGLKYAVRRLARCHCAAVDAAFAEVLAGRPRPVGIEIPHDYLSSRAAVTPNAPPYVAVPGEPDVKMLEHAGALIDRARLPVLYVGGGIIASAASTALRTLAERIGAPVVMSDNGRRAIDDRHPLAMNGLAGRAVFEHADIVVVIGSRFIDALTPTPSWPTDKARFIHVNVDSVDLGAPRRPEVAIEADARVALEHMCMRVKARVALSNENALRIKAWAQAQIDRIEPQAAYIREMRAAYRRTASSSTN